MMAFRDNREFRVTTLGLWTLAFAPASRAGVTAPGLAFLRSLPYAIWVPHLCLGGILLLLHGPLGVALLASGLGVSGIGTLLAGMGIGVCTWPGAESGLEKIARLSLVAGAMALIALGEWLAAGGLGLASLLWLLPKTWNRVGGLSAPRPRIRWIVGGKISSVASAQLTYLWRCEGVLLLRIGFISFLGIILIASVRRAEWGHESLTTTLVVATPILAAISLMGALALRRSRASLDWIYRSIGVSLRLESLCSLAILGVVAAILALGCAAFAGLPSLKMAVVAVYGLSWALAAIALRGRSREEITVVSRGFAVAVLGMLTVGIAGPEVVAVLLGLAGLAVIGTLDRRVHA